MNRLGYRIEGHCSVCRCKFNREVRKECPRCGGNKLIHAYLLTTVDPDILCEHEAKDDPKPKQRYNNYKKNKKKGRR